MNAIIDPWVPCDVYVWTMPPSSVPPTWTRFRGGDYHRHEWTRQTPIDVAVAGTLASVVRRTLKEQGNPFTAAIIDSVVRKLAGEGDYLVRLVVS